MPLAVSLVELCDYFVLLLERNAEELGIAAVYYGDQERIPKSPTVCVEPDTKRAPLKGATRRTDLTMTVYFLVYHSEVRNVQANRRDADILATKVEDLVNEEPQLGGILIHGHVEENVSGYAAKAGGTQMRAARLTYVARSQQQLPTSV